MKAEFGSYLELREKVSDMTIIKLNGLVKENKLDDIWEEIKNIADLREARTKETNSLEEIQNQAKEESAKLKDLQDKLVEVKSQVGVIEKTAIEEIRQMRLDANKEMKKASDESTSEFGKSIDGFIAKTETLKTKLDEAATVIQNLEPIIKDFPSKAETNLNTVATNVVSKVTESTNALKERVESATTKVDQFTSQVEQTLHETLETGEVVGKLESLRPLFSMISTITPGQSNKEQMKNDVLNAVTVLLVNLQIWAGQNTLIRIASKAKALEHAIRIELQA